MVGIGQSEDQSALSVVIHQGLGLLVEHCQTGLGCFQRVISSLIEFGTTFIADAFLGRFLEDLVVDLIAAAAVHACGKTLDQFLIGNIKANNAIKFGAQLFKSFFKEFSLGDSAGESVEDEAVGTVGLSQTGADHTGNELIGNKLTGFHKSFSLFAGGGLLGDLGTEDVTGGNVGNLIGFEHQIGNSPLSGAGGTEKDQIFTGKFFHDDIGLLIKATPDGQTVYVFVRREMMFLS